jgi:hypothetical protein
MPPIAVKTDASMKVKWERNSFHGPLNRRRRTLRFFLVENYQTQGKIKERRIGHLGDIEERFLNSKIRDTKAFHQGLFWAKVDQKLDGLRLTAGNRKRIEAEISKLVPRPAGEWALWAVTCVPRHDA